MSAGELGAADDRAHRAGLRRRVRPPRGHARDGGDGVHGRRAARRRRRARHRGPPHDGETVKLLAESTLAIVLFGDAARIDLRALRGEYGIPARLLGIGLPLTIAAGLLTALLVFGSLAWPEALVLAIVLAPTDAALGQTVVTLPTIPSRVRQGLNIESGLNDGLCVPLFAASLAVASAEAGDHRRPPCGDARGGGNRVRRALRSARRRRRGSGRARIRPARPRPACLAPGRPGRRRGARLQLGGRRGRLGVRGGVRRRDGLRRVVGASAGRSATSSRSSARCSAPRPSPCSARRCSSPRSATSAGRSSCTPCSA